MSITFLADQCVGVPIVRALRHAGFDVVHASDVMPGATDPEILAFAEKQGRILLTEDTDFGELVVRMGMPTIGVVRLDLEGLDRNSRALRSVEAIQRLGSQMKGALVTIEPQRTRIRPL